MDVAPWEGTAGRRLAGLTMISASDIWRRWSCAVALSVTALSLSFCREPSYAGKFVLNSERDAFGRYVFEADMSDTASSYSFRLHSVMDCRDEVFRGFAPMPAVLLYESPSERLYEDYVLIDRKFVEDKSYFSKMLVVPLRSGVRPVEAGKWKVFLSVPDDTLKKYGISGFGMEMSKQR